MKIKDFNYVKKNGDETKPKVLILHEDNTYMQGIDFKKLTDNEIQTVTEIQQNYEDTIKPFINKAYRRYFKDKINREGAADGS